MNDIRHDVHGTLRFLGYGEIRTADGGQWKSLEAVDGRFGTTDETEIVSRKNVPTCRLLDRETGEQVATARKSEPIRRDKG
jgi:hypothetical protein